MNRRCGCIVVSALFLPPRRAARCLVTAGNGLSRPGPMASFATPTRKLWNRLFRGSGGAMSESGRLRHGDGAKKGATTARGA